MRRGAARDDGPAARLRREALASRPAFSPAFHRRVLQRLATEERAGVLTEGRTDTCDEARRSPFWPAAAATLTAVLSLMAAASFVAPWSPGKSIAVVGAGPATPEAGIDRLPMFDEIESEIVGGLGSLAADFVGLPPWRDMAEFDVASLVASDDAGR